MIRRLLLGLSIAMCLATAILWSRTLHTADGLTLLTHADTAYTLATHPRGINLSVSTNVHSHPPTYDPIFADDSPHEGWAYSTHPWNVRVEGTYFLSGYSYPFIITAWPEPTVNFLGVGFKSSSEGWTTPMGKSITQRVTILIVPMWVFVALFSVPLVLTALRSATRRRRIRSNRCPSCGYDLRASPGQCPECGAATRARRVANHA